MRAAHDRGPEVAPSIVHEVLRSPGQPLDAETRAHFEPRFGHDFGKVRVHADAQAAVSARAVNALAFTVGNHVVLGDHGEPSTSGERGRLLAHELMHVVQQSGAGLLSGHDLRVSGPEEPAEHEAAAFADLVSCPAAPPNRYSTGAAGGAPVHVQRDVAIEPVVSESAGVLSRTEIVGALAHNRHWITDPGLISKLRDVLGIDPMPAVIDEDFVRAVARWQAENGLTQDGRIGQITRLYLAEELEKEGLPLEAARLRATAPAPAPQVDIDTSFCGCQQQLRDSITDNLDFIDTYERCKNDPHNHTGDQIESCVNQDFAARGIPLSTAGTTSSVGQIQVAPVAGHCGALTRSETFAHEWSHSTHQRELVRRFGSGTPAFDRAWNESTDWADDEIRARVVGDNFLLWVIASLDQMCGAPAAPAHSP
jgi:hypothetical protein